MTGLVAHHVAQQLLEQRLLRDRVEEAERSQRQTLDHHLHAEIGHVPPAVVDDVVEQHPQVSIDLEAAAELLIEVAAEHLDVAGFVDDLGACVQLGVVPRHGLDDLRGADQRTLLAVQELAELPVEAMHTELEPLLLAPLLHRRADEDVLVETATDDGLVVDDGLLHVDIEVPRQVGGGVPLADLGLLVQLAQRRPRERVVPREDRVGVVLDDVEHLGRIRGGNREDRIDVVNLGTAEDRVVVVVGKGHCTSS